jgi:hypothetical protein
MGANLLFSIVFCFGLLPAIGGAGEVYRWTDKDGVIHFSDSPAAAPGKEMRDFQKVMDTEDKHTPLIINMPRSPRPTIHPAPPETPTIPPPPARAFIRSGDAVIDSWTGELHVLGPPPPGRTYTGVTGPDGYHPIMGAPTPQPPQFTPLPTWRRIMP